MKNPTVIICAAAFALLCVACERTAYTGYGTSVGGSSSGGASGDDEEDTSPTALQISPKEYTFTDPSKESVTIRVSSYIAPLVWKVENGSAGHITGADEGEKSAADAIVYHRGRSTEGNTVTVTDKRGKSARCKIFIDFSSYSGN